MNQTNQMENSQLLAPFFLEQNNRARGSISYLLQALRSSMKSIVKEAFEEVLLEQGYQAQGEDKTLTARELCDRWNISPNTLRNWEIDKRIAPLSLMGRKKIYSMKDVLAVEAAGYIKHIS